MIRYNKNDLVFNIKDKESVPLYIYEAVQIFSESFGEPEFALGSVDNKIIDKLTGKEYLITGTAAEEAAFPEISVENRIKREVYRTLAGIYGYNSPWGAMTGVRPTKIYHNLLLSGKSRAEAISYLKKFYLLSDKKAELVANTFENQSKFLNVEKNDCGFYIGIPFCPTICSYCTFGSSPLKRYEKITDTYVDLLIKEFNETIKASKNYNIKSLYIGGGTPTTLTESQLERLLLAVTEKIDVSKLEEFSVEAGRPDSITEEKLEIIKKFGAGRISINPQTMNDKTLKLIGRNHDSRAIVNAFNWARKQGLSNINMDLICGLPGENFEDFENTLSEISKLAPDSVTVHTLALKRASDMSKNVADISCDRAETTAKMVDFAQNTLKNQGYIPFYMYKQKNALANCENVCFCTPGNESPYNIHIMEEDLTIFGCGVSAVTKIVKGEGDKIMRCFNMKSVEHYMQRFEGELAYKCKFIEENG